MRSLSTNEVTISLPDDFSKTIQISFSLLYKTTVSEEPELLTAVNSNNFLGTIRLAGLRFLPVYLKFFSTEQYPINLPLAIFFYSILNISAISRNIFYILPPAGKF